MSSPSAADFHSAQRPVWSAGIDLELSLVMESPKADTGKTCEALGSIFWSFPSALLLVDRLAAWCFTLVQDVHPIPTRLYILTVRLYSDHTALVYICQNVTFQPDYTVCKYMAIISPTLLCTTRNIHWGNHIYDKFWVFGQFWCKTNVHPWAYSDYQYPIRFMYSFYIYPAHKIHTHRFTYMCTARWLEMQGTYGHIAELKYIAPLLRSCVFPLRSSHPLQIRIP